MPSFPEFKKVKESRCWNVLAHTSSRRNKTRIESMHSFNAENAEAGFPNSQLSHRALFKSPG